MADLQPPHVPMSAPGEEVPRGADPVDVGDPHELLREVAAALRLASWQGVAAVARVKAPALPVLAVAPAPVELPVGGARSTPTAAIRAPATAPTAVQAPMLPAFSFSADLAAQHKNRLAHVEDMFVRAQACTKCPRAQGRLRVVPGGGSTLARLLVVLEAPSLSDEQAGRPAQGEAGELLNKMLLAMGLHRDDVWLTYLCLCRGASDTPVSPSEAAQCSPWLRQQWETINPSCMVIFGEAAARFFLRRDASLATLRGQWQLVRNAHAIATWSLAEVLADPAKKREVWADLQQVMRKLGLRK